MSPDHFQCEQIHFLLPIVKPRWKIPFTVRLNHSYQNIFLRPFLQKKNLICSKLLDLEHRSCPLHWLIDWLYDILRRIGNIQPLRGGPFHDRGQIIKAVIVNRLRYISTPVTWVKCCQDGEKHYLINRYISKPQGQMRLTGKRTPSYWRKQMIGAKSSIF